MERFQGDMKLQPLALREICIGYYIWVILSCTVDMLDLNDRSKGGIWVQRGFVKKCYHHHWLWSSGPSVKRFQSEEDLIWGVFDSRRFGHLVFW